MTPSNGTAPWAIAKHGRSVRSERSARHDRRRTLFRTGIALAEREPITRRIATTAAASIRRALHAKARSFNLRPKKMLSFAIRYRVVSWVSQTSWH